MSADTAASPIAVPPPRVRWVGLLVMSLVAIGLMFTMLLSSDGVRALRRASAPLSATVRWFENAVPVLNLIHVVAFGLLTLLLQWAFPRLRILQVAMLASAFAVLTELLQFLAPGRVPRITDLLNDLLGISIALGLLVLIRQLARPLPLAMSMGMAKGLFLVAVLLLPWEQPSAAMLLGYPLQWADLAFVMALAARGIALLGGVRPVWQSFHGWVLAYLGLMLVAALFAGPLGAGLAKWVGVVYLALLAVLACDLMTGSGYPRRVALAWLVAAALVALVGLLSVLGFWWSPDARVAVEPWLSSYGSLPPGDYPRIRSGFGNANRFCAYLVIGVAIALASARERWLEPKLALGLAGLFSGVALFSWSPALGGLALVLGLAAWQHWRAQRPALARACLAVGLLVAGLGLVALVVNPLAPFAEPSVRSQIWAQALQTASSHPWLGVGLGQPVAEVHFLAPDGVLQRLTDAHNVWLSIAGQAGLTTALVLAGLVLATLLHALRRPHDGDEALRHALAWAVVACWLYQGLSSSVEDTRHAWLLLGMLAGMSLAGRESANRLEAGGPLQR